MLISKHKLHPEHRNCLFLKINGIRNIENLTSLASRRFRSPRLPEFQKNSPPPRRVYEYTFLFFKFELSIILKGGGGPGRPCRPCRPSQNIEPEHRTGTYNRNIEPEHRFGAIFACRNIDRTRIQKMFILKHKLQPDYRKGLLYNINGIRNIKNDYSKA